jgi:hypothetical protein
VVTIAVASLFTLALPPPSDVEAGRAAGLRSFTLMAGYSEAQESRFWVLACLGAVAAGLVLRRRGRATDASPSPPLPPWSVTVGAGLLLGSLLHGTVRGPNPWGTFGFLGEEGVYLGALAAIEHGRLPWRDLEFPYGPLLLAPAWLAVSVFGDDALVVRGVAWSFWAVGIALVGLGTRLLRPGDRGSAWLAAGLAAALHPPWLPTLNSTPLRPALALLPALLAAAGSGTLPVLGRRRQLVLAGALAATAAAFTHELGPPAVLGLLAAWAARPHSEAAFRPVALGFTATAALLLLPLLALGVLPGLAGVAWRTVTHSALGWQALPYPDVLRIFQDGAGVRGQFPPASWLESLWAALPPVLLIGALIRGAVAGGAALGAAVASAVLFRAALGRSDLYHLSTLGAVPVTLALAALLPGRAFLPAALVLGSLGLTGITQRAIAFPAAEEARLAVLAGVPPGAPGRALDSPRGGGVELSARAARDVESVLDRVAALPSEDGVLFWPTEASLYFLADRPLPWRLLWAWDAATPGMEREAIAELERNPPRWVVQWGESFPIDWIPAQELVPSLDAHLRAHWEPVERHPAFTLCRRKAQ